MRHTFSITGVIFGLLAITVAALGTQFESDPKPVEDKRTLREVATEAGKQLLKEKILHEKPTPPPTQRTEDPLDPVRVTYTLLGIIAIGLGTTSWIRKEHVRISASAIALGLVAVAWKWALVAIMFGIVLIFLSVTG